MERYVSLTGLQKIDQRKKADQSMPLLELLVMQVRARGDSVALANIGYPQEGKFIEVTNLELLMKLGVSLTGLQKSVRRSWRPSRRRGSGTGGARRNERGNSRRSGRRRSRTRRKRLMRRMELGAESSTQTESVKLDVYEMLSLFEGSLWLGGCEATTSLGRLLSLDLLAWKQSLCPSVVTGHGTPKDTGGTEWRTLVHC
jgi:hypothetical protein